MAALLVGPFAMPASAQWMPPIGIPAPPFGIFEVAPSPPNPWTASTPGFYYVDATQIAATDTSNTYGTPARPRRTIPQSLPAGAVVELHGVYDRVHTSPNWIYANGTAANPVFIRGKDASTKPFIRADWQIKGSYTILENLEFGPLGETQTGRPWLLGPIDKVALRNSDVHGNLNEGGVVVATFDGSPNTNVVVFNNTIHDNGDVNATFDQDVHGIAVGSGVNNLWVLDNTMYRNSGDGIQIGAGSLEEQYTVHHIYIGRNHSFANKQTGFWVKQASDVIFSQNLAHSHRLSDSGNGQCYGTQYATQYVWFIYNRAYDCEFGIVAQSDNNLGTGTESFFIGNVIWDIHPASGVVGAGNAWASSGIMLAGSTNRRVLHNTLYDVNGGIYVPASTGTLEIRDNVISGVVATADHVYVQQPGLASTTVFHHNLLAGDPRVRFGSTQQHLTTAQLAAVQSYGTDPLFVNQAADDFHLQSGSRAIDTGDLPSAYAIYQQRYGVSILRDADGATRPTGAAMDMGAYERSGPPPVVTADAVNPASGAGFVQTFALQYSDSAGFADLATTWVWFTATLGPTANSCLAYYESATDRVYLLNDAGSAWSSGVRGSSATLQNSQCAIALASTTVTGSGNTQMFNVSVTFKPAFGGSKSIFLYAANRSGVNSDWQMRGTWTVSPPTVTADMVTPSAGSGASQIFALTYSDSAGFADLATTWVWFNTTVASTANACMAYYETSTQRVYLLNDAGSAWTWGVRGSSTTLQNTQCAIALAMTTVTGSGNTLTVNLPVTFKPAFTGVKSTLLYAASYLGANSDWQMRGTWTVTGTGLTADSVTPAAGNGRSQTFALQYSDAAGAGDLRAVWVWFSGTFASSSANTCMAYYEPATQLVYLITNSGSGWTSGLRGSSGTLQNSQCAIALASTTVTASGNTLSLNLPVTFSAAYSGSKTTFMFAAGGGGANSGWQPRGTWTVTGVVTADSVTPAVGIGRSQMFPLQYSDTAGASDLRAVWVWFSGSFTASSANTCMAYYEPATQLVYLITNSGSGWTSGLLGSSTTLLNSQCAIPLAFTTVTATGNTLTLNLPVIFSAAYSGSKTTFMFAAGGGGANSGWQTRGWWTVQ